MGVTLHDASSINNVASIGPDFIKSTLYYKRCHLSKGVRCIYLPINS